MRHLLWNQLQREFEVVRLRGWAGADSVELDPDWVGYERIVNHARPLHMDDVVAIPGVDPAEVGFNKDDCLFSRGEAMYWIVTGCHGYPISRANTEFGLAGAGGSKNYIQGSVFRAERIYHPVPYRPNLIHATPHPFFSR